MQHRIIQGGLLLPIHHGSVDMVPQPKSGVFLRNLQMIVRFLWFASHFFVMFAAVVVLAREPQRLLEDEAAEVSQLPSRRLIILLDRTAPAMRLLFNSRVGSEWHRLFGSPGSTTPGAVETWLQSRVNLSSADWTSTHVDVYSFGFKGIYDHWQHDYLQDLYRGRGDPFQALNKKVRELRWGFHQLRVENAALPMVLGAIKDADQRPSFQEIYILHLGHESPESHANSAKSLSIPEFEQAHKRTHFISGYDGFSKTSAIVKDHYQIKLSAEHHFIHGKEGQPSYKGTLYEVKPRQELDGNGCFSILNEPFWQPQPGAFHLDIQFQACPNHDRYQMDQMQLIVENDHIRQVRPFRKLESPNHFAAHLNLKFARPANALPDRAAVVFVYRYAPKAMNLGLVAEWRQEYPISAEGLAPISRGLGIPLLKFPISIQNALAKHPDKSASEVRSYYSKVRSRNSRLILIGIFTLLAYLIFLIYSRRRCFPDPQFVLRPKLGSNPISENRPSFELELEKMRLDTLETQNSVRLGHFELLDLGGPNGLGKYPPVHLQCLSLEVIKTNPQELKIDAIPFEFKGVSDEFPHPFFESMALEFVFNPQKIANLAEINFPNNRMVFEVRLSLRLERPQVAFKAFERVIQIIVPLCPISFSAQLEWHFPKSHKKTLEYAGSGPKANHLGNLVLRDLTPYHFRKPTTIRLKTRLIHMIDQNGKTLPSDTLSYRLGKGQSMTDREFLAKNQCVFGDRTIGVFLDFGRMAPVMEEADFEFQFTVLIDQRKYEGVAAFRIKPNQRRPGLDGIFRVHFDNPVKHPLAEAMTGIDLRTEGTIFQSDFHSMRLLSFELWNRAVVDLPGSELMIEDVQLKHTENDPATIGLLNWLIHFDGDEFYELTEPIALLAGSPRRLKILINAYPDQNDAAFEESLQSWNLIISHRCLGQDQIDQLVIPLDIRVKPNNRREVVAIDFGNSAITVAHSTEREGLAQRSFVPLKRLWCNRQQGAPHPYEQDEYLLTSSLKSMDDPKRGAYFVLGHSKTDPQSQPDRLILHLKSYIGQCKAYCKIFDKEYPVGEMVRFAFEDLIENYLRPHRDGRPFKRLVMSHPNNFLEGQIQFLADKIRSVLPEKVSLVTITESDAMIYSYLENRAIGKQQGAKERVQGSEQILSFDMGAGTVDLSLRRISHSGQPTEASGEKPDTKQLLGMASVNGAGNLLDEIIAEEISKNLDLLFARFENLVEHQDIHPKSFHFFSCTQAETDPDDRRSQAEALVILLENIKQAKREIKPGGSRFSVKMPQQTDTSLKDFLVIQENVLALLCPDPESLPILEICENGEIQLHISLSQLLKRIAVAYFPSQIYQPLDAVLKNAKGAFDRVDTLLISGRAAMFPKIREAIISHVSSRTGKEPSVPHIDLRAMKTSVAVGSLQWGIDKLDQKEIFSSPRLFGILGLALLISGSWKWYPLIFEIPKESSDPDPFAETPPLNVRECTQLIVLHTPIRNDGQVLSFLSKTVPGAKNHMQQQLEAHGLFRILKHFQHFNLLRNYRQVVFSLKIIPPEGQEMRTVYDASDSEYPNLRVCLGAKGEGGQFMEIDKSLVVAAGHRYLQEKWPERIFSKETMGQMGIQDV